MKEKKEVRLMPQMKENLSFCLEETAQNKPVVIVIDGGLGQGKTTLAVELVDQIHKEAFPLTTIAGMGGKDFIEVYDAQKQIRKALIYDEAGDYARRGAMTRFNQDLGRIFETFRAFKVIVVIVLPRFWWLDNKIYELGVVNMLIHCYGRKQAYGRYSVWFPDTIDWLISRADKMKKMGLPQKLCYGKVSPNQRGLFWDLPAERSKDLTAFGLRGKSLISESAILSSQNLMSIKDICAKLGRSYQWVQRRLKARRVRPEKVYKNKNYYNKEIINALLDEFYGGGR